MEHVKELAKYLGLADSGEKILGDTLLMLANKHDRDAEIHNTCKLNAEYSKGRLEALKPFTIQYGILSDESPERLRSALFHDNRVGGPGLLHDLSDLSLLVNELSLTWTSINQAANSLHDKAFVTLSETAQKQTGQLIDWLKTKIKNTAPQAIIVPAAKSSEVAASLPKKETPATMFEILWSPLAAGVLAIIVGLISVAAGRPWLFPSLGPTAYLQAANPAHPSSKLYNVITGHMIGLFAGFLSVTLLNAWNAPVPLIDHVLVAVRVWAAMIALMVTVLTCLLLKADHPPAAATTLLVALGSISTLEDALNLGIGALIIAAAGELIRRLRLKGSISG